jgi:hypothetical protein
MSELTSLLNERFNTYNLTTVYDLPGSEQDKPVGYSYLGTPVFSNISFEATDYHDFDDGAHTFEGATLNICLMNANRENIIIETAIQGRNGMVMEQVSNGNYRITVNGFLDSTLNNVAPYEEMDAFNQLGNVLGSVKVNSHFLNSLDISEVVVNSINFAEIEGTRNLIAISLNLTSETPVEIRLA